MAAAQPRKSHEQRKLESEEKLFNALINIINSDGINAATCERIGLEAGVSRGLANQRLGKREEMFARLVDRLTSAQWARLEAKGVDSLSSADALRAYIDLHFEDLQHNPGYQAYFVLVAGSIAISPLLKDCVLDAERFVHEILVKYIRRGIDKGEFQKSVNPELQAAALGSYLLGYAIQSKLSGTGFLDLMKPAAYTLVSAMEIRVIS